MNKFDVLNIELKGSNLIEASAGTGKTYSLAILALRLIIEQNIPLKQILMVTFTNAATAELKFRIRKFTREAYRYLQSGSCSEEIIKELIDLNIQKLGKSEVVNKIRDAVKNLDETSVMTIHSFCQETLSELPFETNHPDRMEVLTDLSPIVDYEVNEFWRREISIIDKEILKDLQKSISKEKIASVIYKHLQNREFLCKAPGREEALQIMFNKKDDAERTNREFEDHVLMNFSAICENARLSKPALNFLRDKCEFKPEKFIELFGGKINTDYAQVAFSAEQEMCLRISRAENDYRNSLRDYASTFCRAALDACIPEIQNKLRKMNVVSFDGLIQKVHAAAVSENSKLITPLNSKYKAGFIDEFQDTDKFQYEIFDRVFDGKAILFYIGDPKQSIYGWRSADLATYLTARKKIGEEKTYSMDTNFRSTQRMVESLNRFFQPYDDFDAFSSNEIRYRKVVAKADQGDFLYEHEEIGPITIVEEDNYDEIYTYVGEEILRLLTDEKFKIKDRSGILRGIVPSDIAVLVRAGEKGMKIKSQLAELGVPAVTMDEQKVLDSSEASLMKKVMTTVLRPNRKSINSLLGDAFFGYDLNILKRLNDEKLLEVFSKFKESWAEAGIYNMMSAFLQDFSILSKCLSEAGTKGQRSLTNIYQIMEILHNAEIMRQLKPAELLAWFEKANYVGIDKDEYQQRIESDEKAVQIMTIHKCKGLTFNIVFAPFLDLYKHSTNDGFEFRDENDKFWFTYEQDEKNLQLHEIQRIQENKRLIYVALTRAVYKNYININNDGRFKNSELKEFQSNLTRPGLDITKYMEINPDITLPIKDYVSEGKIHVAQSRPVSDLPAFSKYWDIHSFSSMSHKHESVTSEEIEISDEYDRFVFNELPKGAKAGLFLHSIFEHMDFTNVDDYKREIETSGRFYTSVYVEDQRDQYLQLVRHCLEVKINNNSDETFSLNQVRQENKLPELEFYYSLDSHKKSSIREIIPEVEFTTDPEIEGMMHGFIDLFFEYNKKYYILDWKSNFLGNKLNDYGKGGMEAGMRGSNYHLQYYIYTIAMIRYLKSKKEDFDYEKDFGGVIYMFLRGVRSDNSSTGIFYDKPLMEKINRLEAIFNRNK